MRAFLNKTLGALLLWMLLPTALLAQKGGYWVLDEMSYDSRNSYYYIRSYTKGTVVRQYARNVRSGNTIQVGADSGLLTEEEAKRYDHGFTGNSVMVGSNHMSRLSWSTPPDIIKVGEERKIVMDASLELNEYDRERNLQYSFSLSRINPRGFVSYPSPDRADPSADTSEGFKLNKDQASVKKRAFWTKDHPMPASFAHPGHLRLEITISSPDQPTIYYRYKFVPDMKEVNAIRDRMSMVRVSTGGAIPCGPLNEVTEYQTEHICLPRELTGNGEFHLLTASGDSMIKAGINDGDRVIIRLTPVANRGDIVACIYNGCETTLKRYYPEEDEIVLMPENDEYEPIHIVGADREKFEIQGVATMVIKKL